MICLLAFGSVWFGWQASREIISSCLRNITQLSLKGFCASENLSSFNRIFCIYFRSKCFSKALRNNCNETFRFVSSDKCFFYGRANVSLVQHSINVSYLQRILSLLHEPCVNMDRDYLGIPFRSRCCQANNKIPQ